MFVQSDSDNQFEDDSIERIDQYCRYSEEIDKSKYKTVYKAFNELQGIDVAWQKINLQSIQEPIEKIRSMVQPTEISLELDHPSIIKCYKYWLDEDDKYLNIISELFTSGNLRQYRRQHQKLELKAIKKFAKQVLKGIDYLHKQGIVHGDIRPGKIYVNGHSGEIKIGDLGLTQIPLNLVEPLRSTTMSRRNIQAQESLNQGTRQQLSVLDLQNQSPYNQNRLHPENYKPIPQPQNVGKSQSKQQNSFQVNQSPPSAKRSKAQFHEDKTLPSWDIFCYGLCILELITLEQQDFNMQQPYLYLDTLEKVQDQQSREFILHCFDDVNTRPSAENLLANSYLKLPQQGNLQARSFRSDHGRPHSPQSSSLQNQASGSPFPNDQIKGQNSAHSQNLESLSENMRQDAQNSFSKIGLIRGEDYNFEFSARQEDGQINFRLVMRPDESQRNEQLSRSQSQRATKIDFVFNPDEDTADGLAQEMAQQFDLSVTDMEICAAAIKEWLARELPDQDDQNV